MQKGKKIRDVVYGFIELDEQECAIIDHPAFQRLRRIKQLALTDEVYPGACHTRFEHSIGVMQMATDIFDHIFKKENQYVRDILYLDNSGIEMWRKKIRIAALLHDIGHAPFSHAGEDLMPLLPHDDVNYVSGSENRYVHEQYSIQIIKSEFKDIIESHKVNRNYGIKVEDITALLGDNLAKQDKISLLFKEIISGQIDADRADYLLRDSFHIGVQYGIYDRNLLINSLVVAPCEDETYKIAVDIKGWHVAESLVLARYQMFLQVYFHKVRRIYDFHINCAVKEILKTKFGQECYPSPKNLREYLDLDDWKICGYMKAGNGGKHGNIILKRNHYKCLFETHFIPSQDDIQKMNELREESRKMNKDFFFDDSASTAWYKPAKDILVWNHTDKTVIPLSEQSPIIKSLIDSSKQQRFYREQ